MTQLLINQNDGQYFMEIANTELNQSIPDGVNGVRSLAEAMQQGGDALNQWWAANMTEGTTSAQFFGTTDEMFYLGDFVIGATEGEFLSNILEDAGEDLLALL